MDNKIGRKICLLGDPAVGKTSLIKRFVYDRFDSSYISTMGTKISRKEVQTEKSRIVMLIWDILGQNSTVVHTVYYKGAKGVIVVGDITRRSTLEHIPDWIDEIKGITGDIPVIIAINKMDLESERCVGEEEVKEMFRDYDLFFTSAKKGDGVEDAFIRMANMIGGD